MSTNLACMKLICPQLFCCSCPYYEQFRRTSLYLATFCFNHGENNHGLYFTKWLKGWEIVLKQSFVHFLLLFLQILYLLTLTSTSSHLFWSISLMHIIRFIPLTCANIKTSIFLFTVPVSCRTTGERQRPIHKEGVSETDRLTKRDRDMERNREKGENKCCCCGPLLQRRRCPGCLDPGWI